METVVRRNAQSNAGELPVLGFHRGYHARRGPEDGSHGAAAGSRQRVSSGLREVHSVLEAEHPRRLGRSQFTGAVSDHHRGLDADARPQRGERALERIESGLLPGCVAQVPRGIAASEHHIQKGGVPSFQEHRLAAVQD